MPAPDKRALGGGSARTNVLDVCSVGRRRAEGRRKGSVRRRRTDRRESWLKRVGGKGGSAAAECPLLGRRAERRLPLTCLRMRARTGSAARRATFLLGGGRAAPRAASRRRLGGTVLAAQAVGIAARPVGRSVRGCAPMSVLVCKWGGGQGRSAVGASRGSGSERTWRNERGSGGSTGERAERLSRRLVHRRPCA